MSVRNEGLQDYRAEGQGLEKVGGPWIYPSRRPADGLRDWPAGWWILPGVMLGALIWGVVLFGLFAR